MYNKYPYTDFHELNLDWFLAEFKQLKADWETTSGQWDQMQLNFQTLEGTVQTFTTFVENYFENLDVQEEINTKLDQMAQDGTLADLLAPLVDDKLPNVVDDKLGAVVTDQLPGVVTDQLPGVVGDQIGDAVAPEVPAAVTDWLEDNVNPVGSAVTVDSSLTIAGSAADAKVCGDKFNDIDENLDNTTERINPSKNIFNYGIFDQTEITENDGVYSGTATTFSTVPAAANGVIRPFEADSQYTMSMRCYTDGNSGTTGNGIFIRFYYTDNTYTTCYMLNSITTETLQFLTSTPGKSVDHISFGYVSQGPNIWHIREVQIEKGNTVTSYVEPYLGDYTAKDIVSRDDIQEIKDNILPWYSIFEKKFLKIAYSAIWVDKINTSTHWLFASDMGFNALKGDVEITSDGELIMCHDPGFTFDANGRIIAYDANNNVPIYAMTYAECRSKVYADNPQRYGGYCPVADIDDFISICKEKGKICFVTIRSTNTAMVVQKLISKIRYYNMESRTIINALSSSLLDIVRQNHEADDIAINLVAPEGVAITTANVDTCIGLKRCFLTIWSNGSETVLDDSTSAIAYAKSKNIPLLAATFGSISYWNKLIEAGVIGGQIHKPIFDVDQNSYRFTAKMTSGVVSFGNLFASDRYSATISKNGSVITISDIKITGSRLTDVIDGLQPIKMNMLNPEIRCLNAAGSDIPVKWENNSIKITVPDNTDNTYTVLVRV